MAVIALYVLGGLAVFPITLLIAATALVFDPLLASVLSFVGVLANAAATYAVGLKLIRTTVLTAFGSGLQRVSSALTNRGVIAIALIRMLPIAPFTLINVAAGSMGVRWRDYLLGTALGIAPGVLALTLFSHRLKTILTRPTLADALLLAGVLVGWIALLLVLQALVARRSAATRTGNRSAE